VSSDSGSSSLRFFQFYPGFIEAPNAAQEIAVPLVGGALFPSTQSRV